MSKRGGSNVVFVGNIPYDISEEQLVKVFSEVGRVVDFRLVSDKEQGKFKGYGFCEYEAASAVRNLNDVEVGGRPLRLDFAESDPMGDGDRRHGDRGRTPQGMPAMPQGTMPPPGVPAADAITQTIASLPPNQLMDILMQMKALTAHAPEQARQLLSANPQLTYAVFHAMLMMNVVDPVVLQRVLGDAAPTPQAPSAPAPPTPVVPPTPAPAPAVAPAAPTPVPPAAPPAPQLDEQQRQLLQQVLQLTPEQINALPPDQRASILQLKAQFGQ